MDDIQKIIDFVDNEMAIKRLPLTIEGFQEVWTTLRSLTKPEYDDETREWMRQMAEANRPRDKSHNCQNAGNPGCAWNTGDCVEGCTMHKTDP